MQNSAYSLSELSPTSFIPHYYQELKQRFLSGSLLKSKKPNWLYYYAKDMAVYEQVEQLFSLLNEQLLAQQLQFDCDCRLIELHNPSILQTLLFTDIHTLTVKEITLDSFNMVLLDTFLERKPIHQAIQDCSVYFNPTDIQTNRSLFQELVLDRLKELMYLGAFEWSR